MSSLLSTVMESLGASGLAGLAQQIGAGKKETSVASGTAVATIVSALARNSRSGEGANALKSALEKDHDGGLLDDLSGFLKNPEIGKGDGILRHALGARRGAVESGVARASGLDTAQSGKLLATLAPLVMGALGKQQRQKGLDAGSLTQFLGGERDELEKKQPGSAGILGALLDTDGDGDVDISDLAKHGKGLLGRFLGK